MFTILVSSHDQVTPLYVYYFSHDANALSDPKILAMRCDYRF